MRVFIGPQEIAGYYGNLAKGFQEIGVKSDFFTYSRHKFEYGGESSRPILLSVTIWVKEYIEKNQSERLISFILRLVYRLLLAIWFIFSLFRYEVFIFGFGQSLLPRNLDLPLLQFFGKRVISNLGHGAEARPPYIDGAYQSFDGEPIALNDLYVKSHKIKKLVSFHLKYANVVIGAPLSSTMFANQRFINSFYIGLPFQSNKSNDSEIELESNQIWNSTIRILHSPSHPAAKGSNIIEQAIESLKKKGYKIEFILIHGRSNSEVLNEIQKSDFVIDQVYSDTPMAGFATESAWFGKPSIVGGYGWEALKNFVKTDLWPPSLLCHPDNLLNAIEDFLIYPQRRIDMGKKAKEFVQKKWSAVEVAKKYQRIINNDIPVEWWINPKDVHYFEGAGQSEERTRQNIRELVKDYGIEALQLSHRPDLEAAFLKFARIESLDE